MNFGLFMMPVHHPDKGLPRTIKEDMHTIVYADELGFLRGMDWGAFHY